MAQAAACANHPLCVEAIDQLAAIAAAELGAERADRLLAQAREEELCDDAGCSREPLFCEAFWDGLAAARPEAFVGTTQCCSAVGLAYRYARRRTPWLLAPVHLTSAERRLLRETRELVRSWSGLARWRGFRHVAFDERCDALAATVALRRAYGGGFAFAWHRDLGRTALYPARRIEEFRAVAPATLISVLLHEETHLATALNEDCFPTEDELVVWVREAAAEVVQHTACLIATGYAPTRADLVEYCAEVGEERLIDFAEILDPRADVPELLARVSELAVVATRGDEALAAALAPRPLAELKRVLA